MQKCGAEASIGEKLKHPLIEYATTLEDVNRFIGGPEAQRLAGRASSSRRCATPPSRSTRC
jgi:hypothetical protein